MFKALVGFALFPGRLKTRFLPLEDVESAVEAVDEVVLEVVPDFDRDAFDKVVVVAVLVVIVDPRASPDFFGDVFVGLEPFLLRRDRKTLKLERSEGTPLSPSRLSSTGSSKRTSRFSGGQETVVKPRRDSASSPPIVKLPTVCLFLSNSPTSLLTPVNSLFANPLEEESASSKHLVDGVTSAAKGSFISDGGMISSEGEER